MIPSNGNISSGTKSQERSGALERSSLLLMGMTAASRLLGLLRIRIISSLAGATVTGDLLFFTLNIPNNVRKIFAEGAFSSAFVPEYSRRYHQNLPDAKRFYLMVTAVLTLISAVIGAGFLIFGTQLLEAVSGFHQDVIQHTGIVLLGIFSLYTLGIFLTNASASSLQVHSRFFAPSLAPLMLSVSVILSSLLLYEFWGIYAVAAGFAFGSMISAAVLAVMMLRQLPAGGTLRGIPQESRAFFRRWGKLIALQSTFLISQQVSFYLASTLQEGNVIQYSNAIMLWQMPFGIFFASIMTVLYPDMSKHHQHNDNASLAAAVTKGIEHVLTFLIPSALLLTVFSREVCTIVLVSGNYTPQAAEQTAEILRYFAPGMVLLGVVQLFLRKCYLQQLWKKAAGITVLAALLDVMLSILLIRTPLGITGLAAAFTVTYGITVFSAVEFSLIKKSTAKRCLMICSANAVMLFVLLVLVRLFPVQTGGWLEAVIRVMLMGAAALVPLGWFYRRLGISFFQLLRGK